MEGLISYSALLGSGTSVVLSVVLVSIFILPEQKPFT